MEQPGRSSFTSVLDKLLDLIDRNRNIFLGVILVCAISIAAYSVIGYFSERKENKAMDLYAVGEKTYQADLTASKSTNPTSQAPADASQALSQFEKLIKEYPNTKAASLASFKIVDIYLANNQTEKAIQLLESLVTQSNSKDIMSNLATLRLSLLYEKNQQYDKAVAVLEKLTAAKSNSLFKPEAYLRLGLCYERLNQKEKAMEFYKKLTLEFADTTQSQQAQKYLKLLNS